MLESGFGTVLGVIDDALDTRKLLLALIGLATMIVVSGILFFTGALLADEAEIIGLLFMLLALLAIWVIGAVFSGALGYMAWKHLLDGEHISIRDALTFGRNQILPLLLSPLALVAFGLLVVLAEILLLLLGRIPFLGELLVSVAFLPLIALNTLLFIGLAVGQWLIYPIIAEGNTNVTTIIGRIVTLVRHAPARLFSYFILAFLVIFIAVGILSFMLSISYGQTVTFISTAMGEEKWLSIVRSSDWGLFLEAGNLIDLESLFDRFVFGGTSFSAPFSHKLAAFLMGISSLILFAGVTLAFPWSFIQMVSASIYLNMRDTVSAEAEFKLPTMPNLQRADPSPPPTPVTMSECLNCHESIPATAKFCKYCGTSQEDVTAI